MSEKDTISRYINADIINRFWPIAITFLVVYIPLSFFVLNDPLAGWFLVADTLFIGITLLFYFRTKKVDIAANSLAFVGIPVLLPWLVTGGPANTGLWVSVVYVIWVFFLTTKRWAIFWLTLHAVCCAVMVLLSQAGYFKIAYSVFELANLLFIYVLTCGLVYFFNEVNEYYFNRSNEELAERKKAEEKFKVLLESTPDALVITGADGNVVMVNRRAEEVFGYNRTELIGRHANELVPGGFTAQQTNLEFMGRHKAGGEFPVEIAVNPLKAENLVLYAVRDITDHKMQAEKLRSYSILEAKSKEMEQFTYIASHDLRHPLLTILNYIKVFEKDFATKLDEDGQMCLELMAEAATRMDKLVLGLLDYSRLSKIKELETVDCNTTMNEVMADLNAAITNSGAQITFTPLPVVAAYPLELRQLFQNLTANAIKFTKKGTTPQVSITATAQQGGYLFEFTDNGIGIPERDSEKIFQIFQRLHATTDYEGIGLGLAYCKKIAELHNGAIGVKSKPGEGSTFYFTIKT